MKLLNTSATKLKIAAGLRTPPVYYKLKDRFIAALKKLLLEGSTDEALTRRGNILKKIKI